MRSPARIDHLLICGYRRLGLSQRNLEGRLPVPREHAGIGVRIGIGHRLELREGRLRPRALGREAGPGAGRAGRDRGAHARLGHDHRLGEQGFPPRVGAAGQRHVAERDRSDNRERGDREGHFALPCFEHPARLPREDGELVFLEMVTFGSLHQE